MNDIDQIRRITPEMIARDIVNVQPMDGDIFNNLFELANHIKERSENPEPFLISEHIPNVEPMSMEEFNKTEHIMKLVHKGVE